ncbi:MAG: DUF86 domain-containing protein [Candidatus Eremiobacteraeota bacterium]|nr:DUF86 domain-containing protein [Candidatus Eremiobacteraeota bacterium]
MERLQDIRKAIINIENFTAPGKESFYSSKLIQSAVIYQIQIVGEATYNISKDFKSRNNEVSWAKIERTQHILFHDYFTVNLDIIWFIVNDHLPPLKKQIEEMLADGGDL